MISLRSLFQRRTRGSAAIPREIERELESIEQWQPPAATPGSSVSVHLVTGAHDWAAAAWALASWCCFSEAEWHLFIHDDGTLPEHAITQLRASFPAARIIRRAESDAALQPLLMAFPFCESFRRQHPGALRVLDLAHFAPGERYITFAPDVLFFRFPREIIDWTLSTELTCQLLADPDLCAGVSRSEARDELNVDLLEGASDAIALLHRAPFDLDFLDTILARTSLLRREPTMVATTLNILGASRARGKLLPSSYEVAGHRPPADSVVARHYQPAGWKRYHEDARTHVRPHLFALAD